MRQRRKEFSPRLCLLLAAGSVFALLGGAFWAGSRAASPAYKRFVSRPLPDGSRYTFRYPANLDDVRHEVIHNPLGTSQLTMFRRPDRALSAWGKFLWVLGQREKGRQAVYIVVRALPAKQRVVRDERRWEDWQGIRVRTRHVYLTDAQTRSEFVLTHGREQDERGQYPEADPVILNSLTVLPLGAPVPSP